MKPKSELKLKKSSVPPQLLKTDVNRRTMFVHAQQFYKTTICETRSVIALGLVQKLKSHYSICQKEQSLSTEKIEKQKPGFAPQMNGG